MEIECRSIQDDLAGKTIPSHFCLQNILPTSSIHIVKTGPFQRRSGCGSNQLGSNFHIRFPPFCSDRKVFAKSTARSGFDALITLAWQTQTWFPGLLQMSVKIPLLLHQKHNLPKDTEGRNHSLIQENYLKLMVWTI